MNRNIRMVAFGLATLAAGLTGCFQESAKAQDGTSEELTITGNASGALAKEDVSITDANGDLIASGETTDTAGAFSIKINGQELQFPLVIEVTRGEEVITTIIPAPGTEMPREFQVHLNDITDRAAREFIGEVPGQGSRPAPLTKEEWEAMMQEKAAEWAEEGIAEHKREINDEIKLCAVPNQEIILEELQTAESALEQNRLELGALLEQGQLSPEQFAARIEGFMMQHRELGHPGMDCGMEPMPFPRDSMMPPAPAPVDTLLPLCPAPDSSVHQAIQELEDMMQAGEIDQPTFIERATELRMQQPNCVMPEPIPGQPIPDTTVEPGTAFRL